MSIKGLILHKVFMACFKLFNEHIYLQVAGKQAFKRLLIVSSIMSGTA